MRDWLAWILAGTGAYCCSFLVTGWLSLRFSVRRLLFEVFLPWGLGSLAIYAWSVQKSGLEGAARANLAVGGLLLALTALYRLRLTRGKPERDYAHL